MFMLMQADMVFWPVVDFVIVSSDQNSALGLHYLTDVPYVAKDSRARHTEATTGQRNGRGGNLLDDSHQSQ